MTLSLADIQTIEGLIAAKMDLVSAFRDLPENDREQIAEDIERFLYGRAASLRKPENFYTPRILASGADINADENGVSRGHSGPTLPRSIDFVGATGTIDSTDFSRVKIQTAGGGADCMFDAIVSACFATLDGFTEGKTFTSLSGCTFKGYSTVQGAVTEAARAEGAAELDASGFVIFVCPNPYAETVTFSEVNSIIAPITIYGGGKLNTSITAFVHSAITTSAGMLSIYDMNVGNFSTSATSSEGDFVRLYNCKVGTLTLGADTDNHRYYWCDISGAITSAANCNDLFFYDCESTTGWVSSGNTIRCGWIGGRLASALIDQAAHVILAPDIWTGTAQNYYVYCTGSGFSFVQIRGHMETLSGASAAKNYIQFDQGAGDAIGLSIDVSVVKPASTTNAVQYVANLDADPIHGAYVTVRESATVADVLLVDMSGANFTVAGPWKDCVFDTHPRAKLDLTNFTGVNAINGVQYFAGTPVHSAMEGQQCWDVTNNLLYINTSSTYGTTWSGAASVGGAATAHTLLDGAVHSDTVLGTPVRGDLIVANSTPKWERKAIGSAETILSSDGTDVSWRAHYVTQIMVFTPEGANLASGSLLPNPGVCIGESGEHGTFALIRAKAIAGTAGSGTNTIVIEADDNPAFSTPTVIYTLALNTSTEVDDTVQDNSWTVTDNFIRARCTAVDASPPSNVVVHVYLKQQAENY